MIKNILNYKRCGNCGIEYKEWISIEDGWKDYKYNWICKKCGNSFLNIQAHIRFIKSN